MKLNGVTARQKWAAWYGHGVCLTFAKKIQEWGSTLACSSYNGWKSVRQLEELNSNNVKIKTIPLSFGMDPAQLYGWGFCTHNKDNVQITSIVIGVKVRQLDE